MTHLTWNMEKDGRCPICNGETILLIAQEWWVVSDEEKWDMEGVDGELTSVGEEVSGYFCPTCQILTSLSLNQMNLPDAPTQK